MGKKSVCPSQAFQMCPMFQGKDRSISKNGAPEGASVSRILALPTNTGLA